MGQHRVRVRGLTYTPPYEHGLMGQHRVRVRVRVREMFDTC